MSALDIPALSLVVLVGASGSGKSTFARQPLRPLRDSLERRVPWTGVERRGGPVRDAGRLRGARFIAGKRLAAGRLTVVDATNVQPDVRKRLVELAKAHDVLPVAVVLDLPVGGLHAAQRLSDRPGRSPTA